MEQNKEITNLYNHAAETIKNAILKGQYEAAKGINSVHCSHTLPLVNMYPSTRDMEFGGLAHCRLSVIGLGNFYPA